MAVPTSPSAGNLWDKICSWSAAHPNLALTLAVVVALGPFLAKPFNIDDPLFIRVAHQVQAHPGDPYGFDVNWYGAMQPMWSVTDNPPLASYYIALAAAILGWSEIGLHFAFLLPALAVVLGTYRLARHFCRQPMLAAGATLLTPVFLVSSTTVMCDVLMLAFWVWAVVCWIEGMKQNNFLKLSAAGLLIALAALTKYYGVCLIPLLAVHGLIENRRPGKWATNLLLPLAALCAYQWITRALYSHALLSEAADYAKFAQGFFGVSKMASGLTALAFTGGCVAVAVFFAPLLWRTRTLAAFAAAALLIAVALFAAGMISKNYPWLEGARRTSVEIQIIFWTFGGICVLALAVADVWERRGARSWLLALWLLGTFFFAAFLNWTVNARSLLPMAPAVGILLARRLEKKVFSGEKTPSPRGLAVCLAVGGTLALLVTRADFSLAIAIRQSAQQVCAKYDSATNMLWFQGHWGFQYYMDEMGASALDIKHSRPNIGENLALPLNNTSLYTPNSNTASEVETITVSGPRELTTWSVGTGAGFYASARGPLPFAFGPVPPESVVVYVWKTEAPAGGKKSR
jgi:hypothetical protein